MSRKKDQNGISYPRMTLIGILEFEKGTKLEYSDPNWNSWGWKARIGISPIYLSVSKPLPNGYIYPNPTRSIIWHSTVDVNEFQV